jgi:hypothetical protein
MMEKERKGIIWMGMGWDIRVTWGCEERDDRYPISSLLFFMYYVYLVEMEIKRHVDGYDIFHF